MPAVRIELPMPFPLRSSNAWLVTGRAPLLIDCGVGRPEVYGQLVAEVEAAGVGLSGLRVLATHGHVDHAGNAARLAREHGTRLTAPRAEADHLETFRRDERLRNDEFAACALAHGMPGEVAAKLRARSHEVDSLTDDTAIVDAVADGQPIACGDGTATVRLAPGHTAGCVLLEMQDNIVATGDTLLEHITSNAIELRDADRGRYHQYLRTLQGLRRYVGWNALPGHGAPFRITDALLDGHLEKHGRRSRRVLDALETPRTAWELLPRVLPHLAQGQTFLGMCEVVGHLHALEIDGLASMREAEGVRRFSRT